MKHLSRIFTVTLVALIVAAAWSPAQAQRRRSNAKPAAASKPKQQEASAPVAQEPPKPASLEQLLDEKKNNPREYFDFVRDKRYELFEKSQVFYLDNVKPIFDELEAIPEETSPEDVAKMRQDLSDAQNRLNILMPSSEQFNNDITSFLTMLLSTRCNPQAIALVKDLDNPSLSYQLNQLKSYEYYSTNMREPLEHIKAALEQNGWKKLKESDAAIRIFDKEWDNTLYLSSLTNDTGEGIPFLNEQMKTIVAMRMKGFDSKDELMQVIENLTPSDEAGGQQNVDAAERYSEIIQTQNLISSLENQLTTISDENARFNELGQQRYEVVEQWYDMREELDKLLMDACKYCVSHPCDATYYWMCTQVIPLLSSVYHKSYNARKDIYVKLFDEYYQHTNELEAFLKRIYPYVRTSGGISAEEKNVIISSLQSLDYYTTYYVHRNEKNGVSSPYLDGIIAELETMLANNFAGAMDKYNSLAEKLREKAQLFTVNGVKFTMIQVEGGTFTMGATPEQGNEADSDEKPAHQVTLSSFMIGQTEVTQELWEAVMGSNPSYFKGAKLPVGKVSWDDCQEFISKLNALTGQNFRLPTEAEWEYAARGGSKSQSYKYSGSNNVDDVAWYDGNSGDKTQDVATKQPNELDIFDMSGNVWEWCQDWYGENYYSSSPSSNPQGPSSGSNRVSRGGGWSSIARNCRVANRSRDYADGRSSNLGFRLAL